MVAAQAAIHWKKKDRPLRWLDTILAIAEHDDAEVELAGEKLLTEAGGPLHFAMKQFDLQHCLQLSTLTLTKSRYIALLTSLHMEFLHAKEARQNKIAAGFLQDQKALRKQWRQQLGISEEESKKIYCLLEWCDAFSLLICQNLVQPEKRGIEISSAANGSVYQLYQTQPQTLTVAPWPFEVNDFEVRYETRHIAQLKFETSAEFRAAFLDAEITENVWKISKMGKIKRPVKV